jgi:hypothetical protein
MKSSHVSAEAVLDPRGSGEDLTEGPNRRQAASRSPDVQKDTVRHHHDQCRDEQTDA